MLVAELLTTVLRLVLYVVEIGVLLGRMTAIGTEDEGLGMVVYIVLGMTELERIDAELPGIVVTLVVYAVETGELLTTGADPNETGTDATE